MKGFGTNEKALISVLAIRDPLQVAAIRQTYNYRFGRNLEADIASEVSGYFEKGLLSIIRGPLGQDIHNLAEAISGPGTNEMMLNDVLLGRSNADMRIIKHAYHELTKRSLEADVKGDLSLKTERHFMMVLAANRAEESAPVTPQQVEQDVTEIYKATEGKTGTDELLVCSILSSRSDGQIRALAQAYESRFRTTLEKVIHKVCPSTHIPQAALTILKEFSGHMRSALTHQLLTATDRAMRDARLLEEAMAGAGTKDLLLVGRVVRAHWDQAHMQQVKGAYRHRFGKDLGQRIRGETSGDYERLMCACIGE